MRWASAVSDNASLNQALESCIRSVQDSLEGAPVDLAVVFVSPHLPKSMMRCPQRCGAGCIPV
jgi:small ligand-binding sensory domain FIST